MIWIAGAGSLLLLLFLMAGLFDLYRNRHTMETWQAVVWALVLILLPVAGLIVYLFWRISRSEMLQDTRDYEGEGSRKRGPAPPVGL